MGYTSKKLSLAEARYPITKMECLAVVWGIKRFKLYLAGKRFNMQTDHKPLNYLKDGAYQNNRVFRWDIPGKDNVGADLWSRTF